MVRRPAVILGVCLLVLLPLGLTAVAADDPRGADSADGSTGPVAPVTTPEGFDSSAFQIRVFDNGSARWTIQHARPLRNETEERNFREFASRFNTQDTRVVRRFRNTTRLLVANVSSTLGRQMTATNFAHRARISQLGGTRGVIELSYTWTNFATVGEDSVVVGDVFEGGMYIFDNQRLVFEHGPDLRFVQAVPAPDSMSVQGNLTASQTITWQGERQFSDNRPLVRFAAPGDAQQLAGDGGAGGDGSDGSGTPTAGGGGDGTGDGPGDQTPGGLGMEVVGLLVVLILGLGIGAAWYVDALPPGGTDAGEPAGTTTVSAEAGAGAVTGGATSEPAVTDEEMLSDEDRVLRLLEENGGRMKQVNIVDETDWSKSKVSMLLSDMEDEGDISKLRVGRENIISLAGQEPDAAGSPFEED